MSRYNQLLENLEYLSHLHSPGIASSVIGAAALAIIDLVEREKKHVSALRRIVDESNCDGAGRNLSACNRYANEALDYGSGCEDKEAYER